MTQIEQSNPNPFQGQLDMLFDDLPTIRLFYDYDREKKKDDEKRRIQDDSFKGWEADPILAKLHGPYRDSDFVDPRHGIAICVTPPEHVKAVIKQVQQFVRELFPDIWLTPEENLHMTVLEIASSKTAEEVETILERLQPAFPCLARVTERCSRQPRLVKPELSFSGSALAINFVPAIDPERDVFSYHHLRRDVYDIVTAAGVEVASRYYHPSAHVTIARFARQQEFTLYREDGAWFDRARAEKLIKGFESIDRWLQDEYAPRDDGSVRPGGMWVVGEDKGLECRKGTIWYGGGEDVLARAIN